MASFTVEIELSLGKKLKGDLAEQGFEFSEPQYTVFSGRKGKLVVTLWAVRQVNGTRKGDGRMDPVLPRARNFKSFSLLPSKYR